jgi:hypothetical protein
VSGFHVLLVICSRDVGLAGRPRVPVEDAVEVPLVGKEVGARGALVETGDQDDITNSVLQLSPLVIADGFTAERRYKRLAVVLEVRLPVEEFLQVAGVLGWVVEVVVIERKEETKALLVCMVEEAVNGVCGPRLEMIFAALVQVA